MTVKDDVQRVQVSIPQDLLDWLEQESVKRDRPKSYICCQALDRWRKKLERDRGYGKRRKKRNNLGM